VDQTEQRDYAEEAANRELLHEEEECPYTATLEQLDLDTNGIAVRDPGAELEFYVDPPSWPMLRELIDAEYQKWLDARTVQRIPE